MLVAMSLVGCNLFVDNTPKYLTSNNVVFGGGIRLEVAVAGDNAQQALDEINEVAIQVNNSIRLDDAYDSPLKVFNKGEMPSEYEYHVDIHIYKMMSAVLEYYDLVQGYFNPAVLPIARLWNVDVEGMAKYGWISPSQPDYLPLKEDVDQAIIEYGLDIPLTESVRLIDRGGEYYMSKLNPQLELDLGGIGKGYLADLCGDIAAKHNLISASFNISGDIYVYGQHLTGVPWRVQVLDPRPRMSLVGRELIVATEIADIGLVTSGDYQRFYLFNYDGTELGDESILVQHIINPLTGIPAGLSLSQDLVRWENEDMAVSSATVVHSSAMIAEILSTAIVSAGFQKGVEIARDWVAHETTSVGVFVLEDDSHVVTSRGRYAIEGDFELYKLDTYNGYKRYNKYN
jgi:thiamine biosynthesis lipoprotein